MNGDRAYSLRNGSPTSITEWAGEYAYENMIHADVGLFVQDQWTLKRLTVTGGLRYDYLNIGAVAQDLPAGAFVPARHFDATSGQPLWRDFSPRLGFAYDLFGDGKTALKARFGRFVQAQGSGSGGINDSNPVVRSVVSVTRTWGDTNGDYNPDCDLVNPLTNGECGQISDLNFGQNNPNATRYDDELMTGLRPFNWEYTASVQRQLFSGVSINVGYYRRDFANFTSNDNQFVEPEDFSHYCITAPVDSRLPGGGGNQICGLYDVSPALFGRNQTVVTICRTLRQAVPAVRWIRSDREHQTAARRPDFGRHELGAHENQRLLCRRLAGCAAILRRDSAFSAERDVLRVCSAAVVGTRDERHISELPGNADYGDLSGEQRANRADAGPEPLEWRQRHGQHRAHPTGHDVRPAAAIGGFPSVKAGPIRFETCRGEFRSLQFFELNRNQHGEHTYGPAWQRPTLVQLARYVKVGVQFDF